MTTVLDPLSETISKVGLRLNAVEFAAAVAESFRSAEPVPEATVQARFRRGHGYRDFRAALREAALSASARVLAIGCGRGVAGRSAEYTALVTNEIYPTVAVDQVNYEPGFKEPANAPYDMVVTHSLLHFVLDFTPLCGFISRAVAAAGCYVMANEPNTRFWRNPRCVAELERVSAANTRRRNLLKYAQPSRYWARLMRALRPARTPDMAAVVNRLLRERLGMRGELSAQEILRIADPHIHHDPPAADGLGSDGLDWDALASGSLSGLKLQAVRTSGYLMRDNPARVPERWCELDQDLAECFPLDGCSFTALWRKRR